MKNESAHLAWAPDGSIWSRWVKPVPVAFITDSTRKLFDGEPEKLASSIPPASSDTAVVVDIDGQLGIFLGVRLARKGYRPIPLYNACPSPMPPAWPDETIRLGLDTPVENTYSWKYESAVDVNPIVSALAGSTEVLRDLRIPDNAPPSFLLDARRHGSGRPLRVGMFDNRSVIFASDFPSSEFLCGQGIRRIVVITETSAPQWDLATVLRQWQAGGLQIASQHFGLVWNPQPLFLPTPSWLHRTWLAIQSNFTFRQSSRGVYGRVIHGSSG